MRQVIMAVEAALSCILSVMHMPGPPTPHPRRRAVVPLAWLRETLMKRRRRRLTSMRFKFKYLFKVSSIDVSRSSMTRLDPPEPEAATAVAAEAARLDGRPACASDT
jgi:hypothetical protein